MKLECLPKQSSCAVQIIEGVERVLCLLRSMSRFSKPCVVSESSSHGFGRSHMDSVQRISQVSSDVVSSVWWCIGSGDGHDGHGSWTILSFRELDIAENDRSDQRQSECRWIDR